MVDYLFFHQLAIPSAITKINYKTYHKPDDKPVPVGVAFLRHKVKTTQ
jgi:hypothetical protein